ncbi:hypothetical protein HYC85_022004 [Camellia sinensis]|uniref:Uncharacterized protein n=1 Tax=Camellia sinensis TaxID=4442 RepID=A0A7J7GK13_CAMSI|nr:hypothetical protein HYC85_022004 [Camellia sinensis]
MRVIHNMRRGYNILLKLSLYKVMRLMRVTLHKMRIFADKERTYNDSYKDLNYIVSEEYSNTETFKDIVEESDDQSWLYEDLEGPNDDVFDETSHKRTEGPPNDVGWYTDLDGDNELISLKGSSDEEDD